MTNGYDWETATGDYRFLLVDRLAISSNSATALGDPDAQSGWNGPDGPPALYFSLAADRSHPRPLQGAAVSGRIHIFAAAEPTAAKVRFLLDGVTVKIENRAPFDLAGTAPDGTARAFDSAVLSPGLHTVLIRRTMNDGSEAPVVRVRFRR